MSGENALMAAALSGWQPIETAPRDGSTFMTFSPGSSHAWDFAGFDADLGDFWKVSCGFDYVTHWMPLPPPPGADA